MPIDLKLGKKYRGDLQIKIAKIEIQDYRHGRHLENLFFAFSPEMNGQWT